MAVNQTCVGNFKIKCGTSGWESNLAVGHLLLGLKYNQSHPEEIVNSIQVVNTFLEAFARRTFQHNM